MVLLMATPFFRFLSSNGDGSGSFQAISNYAVSSNVQGRVFYIQPPAHLNYEVERLIVHIADTANFSADNYGGLGSPLGNGIVVRTSDMNSNVKALTADPILDNAGWGAYCYDVQYISFGSGDNFVQVRWTFGKSGVPVSLDGATGMRLEVVLQDDFSGLNEHTFQVQGTSVLDYNIPKSQTVTNVYRGTLSNTSGATATTNRVLPSPPPPVVP